MIGNVKNSIRGSYHAISAQHIPRYLAEFCFRFNNRFQLEKMIKRLAQAAVNTLPVPQDILKLGGSMVITIRYVNKLAASVIE